MKRGSEENNTHKTSRSPKRQHQSEISIVEKSYGIHIPLDVTDEILSKLPVKSLGRFQCVSKPWSSLITNSTMTWSLAKPRLLVISHNCLHESSLFSLCTYPLNTDKTLVSAEQGSLTLVRGLDCNIVYQYVRGLIYCLSNSGQFAIYNPTTRQFVLLPKIKSEMQESFIDGFFGYDPVENQYKVVCMIRGTQKLEDSYHVFTLGDPKKQWRNIQGFGQYFSPTMTIRVCINGKIYFRASIGRYGNIPKPNSSRNVLLSFDVSSERFDHVQIPDQSRDLTLVNYQGKLGCIRYSHDSAEMWIMEDHTGKQEWWKKDFSMSCSLLKSLGDSTCCIAGVTLNGEVVVMPKKLDYAAQTLYAYYYDPKQEKTRRVEFESNLKGVLKSRKEVRILCVPDHVDNIVFSLTRSIS